MQPLRILLTPSLPFARQKRDYIIAAALLLGDALTIIVAYWLAFWIRFIGLPYPNAYNPRYYSLVLALTLPVLLLTYYAYRLYSPRMLFGGLEEYARFFNALTVGALFIIFLDFMLRRDDEISRGWLVLFWVLGFIFEISYRFLARRLVYWIRRHGHMLSPAILVGADAEGRAILTQLKSWSHSGMHIIGVVDDHSPVGTLVEDDVHVLGGIDDLEALIQGRGVEEIIVASGSHSRQRLLDVFRIVSGEPHIKMHLSSGLFELISTSLHVKELASIPLIEVDRARINGINVFLKRVMDYVVASVAIVVLSPILLLIALLVRLDSPGPALYKHHVKGQHGKEFDAIKFRTMCQDNHLILEASPELTKQFQENFKLKDDPRVTRLGRFLRVYSIDELPQLINVLRGEMSIVGPRFISPAEIDKYGKWWVNLFTVKPGLTGLWQVSGRSDVSYEERVRLDMYYIRNWSIWLDIYLLFATIPAALKKKGAY